MSYPYFVPSNHASIQNYCICTVIMTIHYYSSLLTDLPSFTVSRLNAAAQVYLDLGISKSTKNVYKVGLNKYITFCMEIYHRLLSVWEDTLLLFVTYLAQQHL